MLNILSILKFIHKAVNNEDPRFVVMDSEHILDTGTGIELHMYDDWFKITHLDEVVISKNDLTAEEQETIWSIKKLVTDPIVMEQKKAQYPELLKNRRVKLAGLFENPTPVQPKDPILEENTEEYTG